MTTTCTKRDEARLASALRTIRDSGTTVDRAFALKMVRAGRRSARWRRWSWGAAATLAIGLALALSLGGGGDSEPADPLLMAQQIRAEFKGRRTPLNEDEVARLGDYLQHDHPAVVRAAMTALYLPDAQLTVQQSLDVLENVRTTLAFADGRYASNSPDAALREELKRDWNRTVNHVLRGLWWRLAGGKETLAETAIVEAYLEHPQDGVRYLAVQALIQVPAYRLTAGLIGRLEEDTRKVRQAAQPLISRGARE